MHVINAQQEEFLTIGNLDFNHQPCCPQRLDHRHIRPQAGGPDFVRLTEIWGNSLQGSMVVADRVVGVCRTTSPLEAGRAVETLPLTLALLVTDLFSSRLAERGSETSSAASGPLGPAPPEDALLAALICRMEGETRSLADADVARALLIPEADRRSCAGITEGAKDCALLPDEGGGRVAADTPGTPATLEGIPVVTLRATFVLGLWWLLDGELRDMMSLITPPAAGPDRPLREPVVGRADKSVILLVFVGAGCCCDCGHARQPSERGRRISSKREVDAAREVSKGGECSETSGSAHSSGYMLLLGSALPPLA